MEKEFYLKLYKERRPQEKKKHLNMEQNCVVRREQKIHIVSSLYLS